MPSNSHYICAAARIAQGDLEEIGRRLNGGGELDIHWIVLVKHAFVSLANLNDLERSIGEIYQRHPVVSTEFKKWRKQFDFAKYVRNILIGHTDRNLVAKAIEWKPELLRLLPNNRAETTFLINLFLLETAINTYVDESGRHLVFDGETDLIYPPDWNRFLVFLREVVGGGLAFLSALINSIQAELPPIPKSDELMNLYMKAGLTTFDRITKSNKHGG